MRRHRLIAAMIVVAALGGTGGAFAPATAPTGPATTPAAPTATTSTACTPMKKALPWHHWRDAHPLRGVNACPNDNKRELMAYFRLYRHYREITPYRCQSGKEGTYAIPCYIIS